MFISALSHLFGYDDDVVAQYHSRSGEICITCDEKTLDRFILQLGWRS